MKPGPAFIFSILSISTPQGSWLATAVRGRRTCRQPLKPPHSAMESFLTARQALRPSWTGPWWKVLWRKESLLPALTLLSGDWQSPLPVLVEHFESIQPLFPVFPMHCSFILYSSRSQRVHLGESPGRFWRRPSSGQQDTKEAQCLRPDHLERWALCQGSGPPGSWLQHVCFQECKQGGVSTFIPVLQRQQECDGNEKAAFWENFFEAENC